MTVNKNKNVEFKFKYKTFASYKIIITLLLNMNKFEKKDFKGPFFPEKNNRLDYCDDESINIVTYRLADEVCKTNGFIF